MKTIIVILTLLSLNQLTEDAQIKVSVWGQVVTQDAIPVPGLIVYLVHSEIGRSEPIVTDKSGEFRFSAVPVQSAPYDLEIYWGDELMYRNAVVIQADTNLTVIKL